MITLKKDLFSRAQIGRLFWSAMTRMRVIHPIVVKSYIFPASTGPIMPNNDNIYYLDFVALVAMLSKLPLHYSSYVLGNVGAYSETKSGPTV